MIESPERLEYKKMYTNLKKIKIKQKPYPSPFGFFKVVDEKEVCFKDVTYTFDNSVVFNDKK